MAVGGIGGTGLLRHVLQGFLTCRAPDHLLPGRVDDAILQFIVIDDASASLVRLRSAAPGILQMRGWCSTRNAASPPSPGWQSLDRGRAG